MIQIVRRLELVSNKAGAVSPAAARGYGEEMLPTFRQSSKKATRNVNRISNRDTVEIVCHWGGLRPPVCPVARLGERSVAVG